MAICAACGSTPGSWASGGTSGTSGGSGSGGAGDASMATSSSSGSSSSSSSGAPSSSSSGTSASSSGSSGSGASSSSSGSSSGGAASDAGARDGSSLAPAQGTLLGAFVGTGPVADFETLINRKLALHLNYYGWDLDVFGSNVTDDIANGRIPYSTWEPWNNSVGVPLDDIINGVHDAVIQQRAAEAKALAVPLLLRWAHEMNGNWYPWCGINNGGAAGGPAKYVAAYKHIHDVFVAAGALNVQWVFCPDNADVPGDAWNHWTAYYPGDAYVDWMCFDGYNWGSTMPWGWQTFQQVFQQIYSEMAGMGKPLMIGETASTELGGDKAAWISAMPGTSMSTFPAIKALVWFEINKETDWRVESSASSLSAFQTVAHDPYFNP